MECSLVYRACSTKGIAQGEEIQHRDWEFKSPSNSPPKLEPTMTSLFLQSLQAPPGMSLSSQLPALPSYFLFYLLCLRQWGSPTFILRKTIYSHVSDFSLPTLLCILAPYNLFLSSLQRKQHLHQPKPSSWLVCGLLASTYASPPKLSFTDSLKTASTLH